MKGGLVLSERRRWLAVLPALIVVGPGEELLARVDARYFGTELSVLVGLAAAYRERAMME